MSEHQSPGPALPFSIQGFSRRNFLRRSALLAAAGVAGPTLLAGCDSATTSTAEPSAAASGAAASGSATPSAAASAAASESEAGLVIKAVRSEPMRAFEFRGQAHVVGNIWSDALEAGWTQAAQDLGLNMGIGGPTTVDPANQVAEIESWIIQEVDCIMLSAAAAPALTPSIDKAVAAGIVVVTIDSDAPDSTRHVFDLGANSQEIAFAQIDSLAAQMEEAGEWAFIFGQLTQIEKQYQFDQMQARAAERYPDMTFVGSEECKDDQQVAADQAQALIVRHPNLGGIISNSGSGCIGAAQGIAAAGKSGVVKVTGITFPSLGAQYVKDGTMPEFFLWNISQQAYFSAVMGLQLLTGEDIHDGDTLARYTDVNEPVQLQPSDLDPSKIVAVLGPPLKIDESNVDTLTP